MIAEQIDNAIAEFDHAVKCSKNDASQETLYARYFLANCYEKSHKIEKAIEQWEAIAKRNKNFKDVPSKLNEYKDVQTNDAMKEYLTTAPQQFMEVAKKAAHAGYNLVCQKIEQTNFGCVMLATEDSKDNWKNVRQQIFLVEFFRNSEPLSENVIRKAADLVKAKSYYRGCFEFCREQTYNPCRKRNGRTYTYKSWSLILYEIPMCFGSDRSFSLCN